MSKKNVQIIGKITGKNLNQAKAQFKHAADYLRSLGYNVWNPLEEVAPELAYAAQMDECLSNLPKMDMAVLLDDWCDSPGARKEVLQCMKNEIPMLCLSYLVNSRFHLSSAS